MKSLALFLCCLYPFVSGAQDATIRTSRPYGHNSILATAGINTAGYGPGLLYEYCFSKNNKWSLAVPLSLSIDNVPPGHNGHFSTGETGKTQTAVMVFCEPGIRFYPAGSNGVCRYAVGAALVAGFGNGKGKLYAHETNQLQSRSVYGVLITNTLNIQPSKHIRIGLEISAGYGTDNGTVNYSARGSTVLARLAMGIGYRW